MNHGTTRLCDRHRLAEGKKTGEERQHATGDPCLLMPGDIIIGIKGNFFLLMFQRPIRFVSLFYPVP
jgi:hypothetical protein